MTKRIPFFLLLLLCLSSNAVQPADISSINGFVQGTTYSIKYDAIPGLTAEEMKKNVEKILHAFDMSLSVYQDSSIVSKINRNEEAIPDSFFINVFTKSKEISLLTNGAFDITVGPLVRAWGFGPDEHKNFSEEKLNSLMKLIGMDKVSLKGGKLIKADRDIILDFNAIAQGYSVDVICRYFDKLKIKNYLVEIGGEVRASGTKNTRMWKVGVDRPFDENIVPGANLQAIISLKDRALATSGNYRKFYVENGIKYSHTIDPKTGYPAKNKLLSASILAENCALADGVATACMVMGVEKTIAFLKAHSSFDAYLIFTDDDGEYRTWMTPNLKAYITTSE
jgi:FAD:protein FMN transferase